MHEAMKRDLDQAIQRVLDRSYFILGPEAKAFDEEFAAFHSVRHAIGTGNCLDSLQLVLRAMDLKADDEVITTTHTFVATASAIVLAGAKPVLVDCEPGTLAIDPQAVSSAITARTKGILAVHLYGRVAPMEELLPLAERHGLFLVEDTAQAHGALWRGQRAGSLGTAGCFSFYPTKNLGALGDGGSVITRDDALAERVRLLRNYGTLEKYEHAVVGLNSRLDDMQAAILREKLKRLDDWSEQRRRAAAIYHRELASLVEIPALPRGDGDGSDHVYHLFVIRVADRDRVRAELLQRGIRTEIHYPVPIHRQKAFASFGWKKGEFPQAEQAASELISLPFFVGITPEQQGAVVDALRAVLG
jgi:dTDP-4-amino-4,6-dideoxygalactose transaminase